MGNYGSNNNYYERFFNPTTTTAPRHTCLSYHRAIKRHVNLYVSPALLSEKEEEEEDEEGKEEKWDQVVQRRSS